MKAFLGYPITKPEAKERTNSLDRAVFPYARRPNATTEYTWGLYERLSRMGPFTLMIALVNGELGYVYAVG
jgi:hypothetical protein